MIIVCIIFIIFGISGCIWCINRERKDFNNGVCPHCGGQLRCFDADSSGARGYKCDSCDYTTWVSYNRVDRNYKYIDNLIKPENMVKNKKFRKLIKTVNQ